MKPKIVKLITFGAIFLFLVSVNLFAQREVKSTGIGVRGTYWKMTDDPTRISVSNYGDHTAVSTGSGGGYFYLLSRMNYNTLLELSIGAVGKVEGESHYDAYNDVDVSAITPILLGVRFELLPPESQNSLKPYLSLGGGPYWLSKINATEGINEAEVMVDTRLRSGGYLGGGANFLLTDWFALNFDMRYHFIDFNVKHVNSGFEYGIGVSLMWGTYRL